MNKQQELNILKDWYISRLQHIAEHNELYEFKRHVAVKKLLDEYKKKKKQIKIKYMN